MWKEKTSRRTNHLHFDFLIQKKKKHVGGLKTPSGCFFFFFKTKHQRLTQRVVTTRRNSWRQRQKKKKKRLISCFQCFLEIVTFIFVSCLPPPQEKVLHKVLIEISSMLNALSMCFQALVKKKNLKQSVNLNKST